VTLVARYSNYIIILLYFKYYHVPFKLKLAVRRGKIRERFENVLTSLRVLVKHLSIKHAISPPDPVLTFGHKIDTLHCEV
jgi:hypothetical protein